MKENKQPNREQHQQTETPKHASEQSAETASTAKYTSLTKWDRIRDTFNLWSKKIEWTQRLARRQETKAVTKFLNAQSADKILEIGCNTGWFLKQLHNKTGVGKNYVALDQKISKLAKNRAAQTGATAIEGDGMQTNFKDGSFDKIITSHLLEHFENPSDLLKEINRLLKEDGLAVLAVPREIKWNFWNPKSWPPKFKGHKKHYENVEALTETLAKNGFEVIDNWYSSKNMAVKVRKSPTPSASNN